MAKISAYTFEETHKAFVEIDYIRRCLDNLETRIRGNTTAAYLLTSSGDFSGGVQIGTARLLKVLEDSRARNKKEHAIRNAELVAQGRDYD